MNPALAPKLARRYDLDWLRTAAVLMLIPYHTSRLFDVWEPYYVKNSPTSSALTMLRAFVDPWGMPLLFVIAGAGAFFALQRSTGVQFLRERILRLIIPLVFGLLILVPPQAYFAWLGQGHQASYWKFLQQYWTFNSGEIMGWNGGFTVGHLWFIVWLFAISLVTLPVFLFLRRASEKQLIQRLATIIQRPAAIFAVVILLWMTDLLPGPLVGNLNPFSYLFLFAAGFLLVADPRFQVGLDRSWRWALGLGALSLTAWANIRFTGALLPEGSWQSTARDFLFFFTTWSWIIGLLGFGHCYLNRPSPALAYLGGASYPYYIIHQTVIVALGFFVLPLFTSIPLKYVLIVVIATAATLGMVELAQRWNVTRALLGLRSSKPL